VPAVIDRELSVADRCLPGMCFVPSQVKRFGFKAEKSRRFLFERSPCVALDGVVLLVGNRDWYPLPLNPPIFYPLPFHSFFSNDYRKRSTLPANSSRFRLSLPISSF